MDWELFEYSLISEQATVSQQQRGGRVERGSHAWNLNSGEVLALAKAGHQARKYDLDFWLQNLNHAFLLLYLETELEDGMMIKFQALRVGGLCLGS